MASRALRALDPV